MVQFIPESEVEYRDAPGFPGYKIGSDGSVWSCRNRGGRETSSWHQIKTDVDPKTRYHRVTLCGSTRKRYLLHRLVLEVFVGECPPNCEASHYPDANRANCQVGNLRWETRKANHHHKLEHGSLPRGERHHNAVLNEALVLKIRELFREGMGLRAMSRTLNLSRTTLTHVVRGRTWSHVH